MMTVEKMAKVVSGINRGLASSRPQGVEGTSQARTDSYPTVRMCACAFTSTCTAAIEKIGLDIVC